MEIRHYVEEDATGLAALIARGEVSPAEVRGAAAERYLSTDAALNAIVEWYDDPDPPVEDGGPFFGVPFLRKDAGATEAGRLAEMGSRLMAGHRATVTSPYFERVRAAGLQVVGRSAVPEFAQHGTTESTAFGLTRNPLDPTRSSGGSSGGAASAVRSGVVPLAHATDAAGSIRIPASVTGLIGLKPTRGLVRASADRWNGLLCEFVLTRSVRDARTCLEWFAAGSLAPPQQRVRVAWSPEHWAGGTVDPEVAAAVERAAAALEGHGLSVDVIECPFDYEQLMSTWLPLFDAGVAAALSLGAEATGRPLDGDHLEPFTLGVLDRVAGLTPAGRAEGHRAAETVARTLTTNLVGYDVLLTPTLDRAVIPLGRMAGDCPLDRYLNDTDEWFDRLYLANVTGWPALSLPAPEVTGPPIGVQVMARSGHDRSLLALADLLLDGQIVPPVADWAD